LFVITSRIKMKTGIWLEIAWINTFRMKYCSQSIQIRHSFLVFCLTKDYCESTNAWWNRIWTVIIVVFCRQDLFLFFKLRMRAQVGEKKEKAICERLLQKLINICKWMCACFSVAEHHITKFIDEWRSRSCCIRLLNT